MQVVNFLKIILIIILLYACTKEMNPKRSSYGGSCSLNFYNKESELPVITGSIYDENKNFHPASVMINGVLLALSSEKFKVNVAAGSYDILVGAIGNKYISIENLKINKGDSLHIDFTLEMLPAQLH